MFNPQSLNRYSYVINNPLRYIDPTGHVACQTKADCQDAGMNPGGSLLKPPSQKPRPHGGNVDPDFNILPPPVPSSVLPSINPNPQRDPLTSNVNDLYDQQSVYMSTNDHPYLSPSGEKYWLNYVLVPLAVRQYLLTNTEWYPTFLGKLWKQSPDASSTVEYYYVAKGIRTTDQRGIVLNTLYVGNSLGTETLNVNITASFYDRNILAAQGQGQVTIAPSSAENALVAPFFVPSEITKIVFTLNLQSDSYHGRMQHVIVP